MLCYVINMLFMLCYITCYVYVKLYYIMCYNMLCLYCYITCYVCVLLYNMLCYVNVIKHVMLYNIYVL